MYKYLFFIILSGFSFNVFATSQKVTASTQVVKIDPTLIDYFSATDLYYSEEDTVTSYPISILSKANLKGLEEHDIIVTLGGTDFFDKQTYVFQISGYLMKSVVFTDSNGDATIILIVRGALTKDGGLRLDEFSEYQFTIARDPNNATGYSNIGSLQLPELIN